MRDASRQSGFLPLDTHSIVATYVGHPMSLVSASLNLSCKMLERCARRDAALADDEPEDYVERYGIFAISVIEDLIRSAGDYHSNIKKCQLQNRYLSALNQLSKGSMPATAALERLTSPELKLAQCGGYLEDDRLSRSFWDMDLQFPKPSLRIARWSVACHSQRFVENSLRAGLVLTRFGCTSSDRRRELRVLSWIAEPSDPVDTLTQLAREICAKTTLSIRLDECDPEIGQEFEVVLGARASVKLSDLLLAWRCLPNDEKLNPSVGIEARVHPLSINFLTHVISPDGVRGEVHAKLWFA